MHKQVGKYMMIAGALVFAAEFVAGYQAAQSTDPNTTAPGPGGTPVAMWFANSVGKIDPLPGVNFPLSYALIGLGLAVYLLGGYIERE